MFWREKPDLLQKPEELSGSFRDIFTSKNRPDRHSNPFHIKTVFNLLTSEMDLLKSVCFCNADIGVFCRRKPSSKFGG